MTVFFNQDSDCFVICTQQGFVIYNTDPLDERFRRDFGRDIMRSDGSRFNGIPTTIIGKPFLLVELLYKSNILAFVTADTPTKAKIWDDRQGKIIAELEFMTAIRKIRLRRDRIYVALDTKILIYTFVDLKLLSQINTSSNLRGLLEVAGEGDIILACPGLETGSLHLDVNGSIRTVRAHQSELQQLVLSQDGSLIATASEKGTIVRIFNVYTGDVIRELRRGIFKGEITSICFDQRKTYLVLSSEHNGTIHVYNLENNATQLQRSDIKHTLPIGKYICRFVSDKHIVILGCTANNNDTNINNINNTYYKFEITSKGLQQCKIVHMN